MAFSLFDAAVLSFRQTVGAVGGVLHSLHLSGRAVDLVVDGITASQEELVAAYADQQGLWALWHGEGDNYHLHLQWNEESQ